MLSGETAKGSYPIQSGSLRTSQPLERSHSLHTQSVLMMAETCYLAESAICYPPLYDELRATTSRPTDTVETVAMAAVGAAIEQDAGAILVLSTSGNTARLISKFRPNVPIVTGTLPLPLASSPSLSLRRV
jgi:pyruvate kinase